MKIRISKILICLAFILTSVNSAFAAGSDVLSTSWTFYKSVYINKDGRVIDYGRDYVTTSEGQSYALLRAVVMKDKKTFKRVYKWTKENLKRQDDNLFAWLWGRKPDNTYGKIDENAAADADIDIAYALILASKVWDNPKYLNDAKKIIADIWDKETIEVKGQRILTGGVYQAAKQVVDINPSYFAPYAYKTFAVYDKTRDWSKLADDSYVLMDQIISKTRSHLPPNWFTINKTTGEINIDLNSEKSDFSYDAIRAFFRFYIDYKLNNEDRTKNLLSQVSFFVDKWKKEQVFYTNYKENGELRDNNEFIGAISLLVPVIDLYDKDTAKDIYAEKIKKNYNGIGFWGNPFDYYGQNLTWFGSMAYKYANDTGKYNK